MTEDDIVKEWTKDGPPITHPAWPAFVKHMHNKSYGWDPLLQAWAFFRYGWEAANE